MSALYQYRTFSQSTASLEFICPKVPAVLVIIVNLDTDHVIMIGPARRESEDLRSMDIEKTGICGPKEFSTERKRSLRVQRVTCIESLIPKGFPQSGHFRKRALSRSLTHSSQKT